MSERRQVAAEQARSVPRARSEAYLDGRQIAISRQIAPRIAAEHDDRALMAAVASVSRSVKAAAGSLEALELDRDRELVHELTIPAVAREPLVEPAKTLTAQCVRARLRGRAS